MRLSIVSVFYIVAGLWILPVSAAPKGDNQVKKYSPGQPSKLALISTIYWDLTNPFNVTTPSGQRMGIPAINGTWQTPGGGHMADVVHAYEQGLVDPSGIIQPDVRIILTFSDGYWGFAHYTGTAKFGGASHNILRIETNSPKYKYLAEIDLVGTGYFSGELSTVPYYIPI